MYVLLGLCNSQHWQLPRSYRVDVRWMNGCGALVEYYWQGKIKTFRENPGPVPLCTPQIPYRLDYKWTWVSVVRGTGLTVEAIYLQWEKGPKNAFYCKEPQCIVLHVRVLQIQGVYCLRGYVTETATQLFCLKLATYAKYCISNIWTISFNLLKLTGHVMHQQFNIQPLYVPPTLYLCVLYLSENKQQLVPLTA